VTVKRIVSGGQTGVDRGALDAAIFLGIDHGGWCPLGRLAEDGRIPPDYHLSETSTADYPSRTEANVVHSEGTLILYRGALKGGTELTRRLALKHNRAHLLVDLNRTPDVTAIQTWLADQKIKVLNVAGPRESTEPGIARQTYLLLLDVLSGGAMAGGT
jgi:hypothetical protein